MARRDRHDIVIQMLKETRFGRSKTEIMKGVNMSFIQAQQCLGVLLEKGLLEVDENRRFKVTKKGLDYAEKM